MDSRLRGNDETFFLVMLRVVAASTQLASRFYSKVQGFRLVDSRLRGNDESMEVLPE